MNEEYIKTTSENLSAPLEGKRGSNQGGWP